MFCSTVMLDCLVRGIPAVIPGWMDFGWNHALRGIPSVCLAEDFDDLTRAIRTLTRGAGEERKEGVGGLIARPGQGEEGVKAILQTLWQKGINPAERPGEAVSDAKGAALFLEQGERSVP